MPSLFAQSELVDLIEKVEKGERLNFKAGVRMMASKDILAVGHMANLISERKNGNNTSFIVNRPINLTEIGMNHEDPQNIVMPFERHEKTVIYSQNETIEERIDHLLQVRELQDRTGGFLTFIPLPFLPQNTPLEGTMGLESTTGFEDLKMLAISRILLDNVDHIKGFWSLLGPKLAQVSLKFGVDDLDGTVVEERITDDTGEETSQVMSKRALIHMIQKAGRDAVERDTLYRVLRTY